MGMTKPHTSNINTAKPVVKHLEMYAETLLPTRHGEFRCIIFNDSEGLEHIAMVKGEIANQEAVLCRVHSQCLTSEVFGSLKCDCKHQLDSALETIQKNNQGVLLYLRQEGRGIGLGNKIKAYALQEIGLDTVEANEALSFPVDARNYDLAAEMLSMLQVKSIQLLTNNPLKIMALEQAGLKVARKKLDISEISEQASDYLLVKQKRLGHLDT
jgi:GTP cyclohydrolase II/3,4-dihydroxy 2-butanone 4-phosphate synthase/GTP cyclohydrolase II